MLPVTCKCADRKPSPEKSCAPINFNTPLRDFFYFCCELFCILNPVLWVEGPIHEWLRAPYLYETVKAATSLLEAICQLNTCSWNRAFLCRERPSLRLNTPVGHRPIHRCAIPGPRGYSGWNCDIPEFRPQFKGCRSRLHQVWAWHLTEGVGEMKTQTVNSVGLLMHPNNRFNTFYSNVKS